MSAVLLRRKQPRDAAAKPVTSDSSPGGGPSPVAGLAAQSWVSADGWAARACLCSAWPLAAAGLLCRCRLRREDLAQDITLRLCYLLLARAARVAGHQVDVGSPLTGAAVASISEAVRTWSRFQPVGLVWLTLGECLVLPRAGPGVLRPHSRCTWHVALGSQRPSGEREVGRADESPSPRKDQDW